MTVVQQRLTSLAVLTLVVGAVVAFVLWNDHRRDVEAKHEKQAAKVLSIAALEDVERLTLTTAHGTTVIERRAPAPLSGQSSAWELVSPEKLPGDASTIDGLVRHLVTLERDSKVPDEAATDLTLFGLAPARFTVVLETKSGTKATLEVGKKNEFKGQLYVRADGQGVVSMVPGTLEYQVDKQRYDLREKRLAVFDESKVKAVRVRKRGKTAVGYELVRDGARWQLSARMPSHCLAKPVPADCKREGVLAFVDAHQQLAADASQASGIVSALAGLRAKDFPAELLREDDATQFGLADPALAADVILEGAESAPIALVLGKVVAPGDQPVHYAARVGAGPVGALASDWAFRRLDVAFDELRDKRLFTSEREALRKLELVRGEAKLVFTKGAGGWTLTEPAGTQVSAAKVEGLVYKLMGLRAGRFVHETVGPLEKTSLSFETPTLVVRLSGDEGAVLGEAVFAKVDGPEQFVFVGEPQRVVAVEVSEVETISTKPEDYVSKNEPIAK